MSLRETKSYSVYKSESQNGTPIVIQKRQIIYPSNNQILYNKQIYFNIFVYLYLYKI